MKVLHVNEHLAQKGDVETYLRSLLPLLSKNGIDSYVAYGTEASEELERTYHVPGISRVGYRMQAAVYSSMEKVLKEVRPNVIHIHNVQNVEIIKACISFGVTVFTIHDFRLICPASMFFYKRTKEVCNRKCGPGCFAVTLKKHCLTPRPS